MKYKNVFYRPLFISFLFLALAAGSVQAQSGPKQAYTLKEILEVALENNNNVVKARYDYEEGLQKTREVKSSALPQVNVTADLTDNVLQQAFVFPVGFMDPNAGEDAYAVIRAGMQYSTTVNAQATQQLFNKSVFTGIKAARVSEDFYNQNIARTEEEVIQQVASLFYQVASLKSQRVVLESTLAETQKNLTILSEKFQNGLARKVDVDRLKVNATNIETELRSVDDMHASRLNQLKLLAGIDMNTSIDVVEPLLQEADAYQVDPQVLDDDWAWENKIEYKQLSTQLSLYDLERKNFASGYFPTLSAFASYTYSGQSNDFILSANANSVWFDMASIGLRLTIPVFDGFNKSARMQQSRIRRMKTERDMHFTEQQANMAYDNARKTFETSYSSYRAQSENVALANSVYEVTLQNYNEGVSPLTDLLQAESAKIQAQSQLITSLLKVKQAEVDLLKAKGEIKSLLN